MHRIMQICSKALLFSLQHLKHILQWPQKIVAVFYKIYQIDKLLARLSGETREDTHYQLQE